MNSFVWYRYWPFIVLLFTLRVWFWLAAFPNPDEAYYWLWGQHLDWSYFDHPPFHAWVQGLFATVLGHSHFTLRLPNAISTGLLLGLYWQICQRLYPQQARHAFWLSVLLLFTSPLFFLFLAIAWHDHWLICFGTAASYCLVQVLSGERHQVIPWLYATGLLIGLAGLCKYLALFLGLGFLVGIASDRERRSLLWSRHLYGAIAIALLVMTPVFWWNAHHDFYSFQFYLGRSVQSNSPSLQWFGPPGFLLLSALIFGPVHCVFAVQGLQQYHSGSFGAAYQRLTLAILGTSTICLALLAFKAPVLYYWNILAYPLLFPLMAGIFLQQYPSTRLRYRRWLRGAVGLGSVVALLLVIHYAVFPLSALAGETGDEDTRMVYGWPAIAAQVQAEAANFATPPRLLTTDYRSAAALAYALNDASILALSGRIDQFDFWYDGAALDGRDALLLGDRWHPICPTHQAMFQATGPPLLLSARRYGRQIKQYVLRRGLNFQESGGAHPLSPDYPLAFTSDGEICKS